MLKNEVDEYLNLFILILQNSKRLIENYYSQVVKFLMNSNSNSKKF